jgi:hypothetical protein
MPEDFARKTDVLRELPQENTGSIYSGAEVPFNAEKMPNSPKPLGLQTPK